MSTHQPPDGTGSGRIRHLLLVGAGTALWGLTALLAFSSKALLLVLLLVVVGGGSSGHHDLIICLDVAKI